MRLVGNYDPAMACQHLKEKCACNFMSDNGQHLKDDVPTMACLTTDMIPFFSYVGRKINVNILLPIPVG